jgi:hypothetical protein
MRSAVNCWAASLLRDHAKRGQAAASRRQRGGATDHISGPTGVKNVKTLTVIATLLASSPVLAQTVQPAQHKSGIVDTLIERADTLRCAVIRDDLPDQTLLSGCHEPAK